MPNWVGELIGTIVHVTVALVAFDVGVKSASIALSKVLPGRRLLLESLLGLLVLVPALAVLLIKAAALPAAVSAGLLVTAISVGPVAALEKSEPDDVGRRFAFRLNIVLLALSLGFVPLAVWVIGAAFQRDLYLSVGEVARVILPLQLLPLLAGFAVGRLAPRSSRRAARPLTRATNIVLGAVMLLVVVSSFKPLMALGVRAFSVAVALNVGAVIMGHLLGGPEAANRKVLASFMTIRLPALALALAQLSQHGRRAVPAVVAYLICAGIVYALYSAIVSRAGKLAEHPTDSRPRPLPGS
jgi:BASS family bile acid:Na+ symporter